MGNTNSTTAAKNLTNEIDRIATYYIFSMTDDVLSKMSEKDYCNKLVILTAKVFDEKLNNLEKKKMLERVAPVKEEEKKPEEKKPEEKKPEEKKDTEEKKPEEKKDTEENKDTEKDKEKNKDQDKLKGGDETEPAKAADNKEDCLKIAKFYVKIAHVYAAIMKTINPVITTSDKQGNLQKYDLSTTQKIPSDADIKNIRHNNFCNRRLTTLLQDSDINKSDPNKKILKIKPRFCDMNYDKDTKKQRIFALKGGQFSVDEDDVRRKKKKNKEEEEEDEDDDKRKKKKNKEEDDEDDDKRKKKKNKEEDEEDEDDDKKRKKKNKEEDEDEGNMFKKKLDLNKKKDLNKFEDDDPITPFKKEREEKDLEEKNKKNNEDKDKKPTDEEKKNGDAKDTIKKPLAPQKPVIIKEDKVLKPDNAEIGIPELKKLYYDVYDEKTKTFSTMSPDMKKEYEKDVAEFYLAFTGEKMPMDENGQPKFKTFDQIALRDFKKNDGCKPDGIFTKEYEGLLTTQFGQENLFIKYANHVQQMMKTMNENQDKLLVILKQLFTFKSPENDINNNVGEVIINPSLDEKILQGLINTTRKLIVKLYIRCETDFLEGIHIFEAIVAKQLAKTINSQVTLLDEMTENYLEHTEL